MSVEVKLAVHFSHWLNLPQLRSCINRDAALSQVGESQPGHPHADCWHPSYCPVLDQHQYQQIFLKVSELQSALAKIPAVHLTYCMLSTQASQTATAIQTDISSETGAVRNICCRKSGGKDCADLAG